MKISRKREEAPRQNLPNTDKNNKKHITELEEGCPEIERGPGDYGNPMKGRVVNSIRSFKISSEF